MCVGILKQIDMQKILNYKKELYTLLGTFIVLSLLPKRCTPTQHNVPRVTVERDTIWQTRIDTFKIQTTQYKTVYVSKKKPAIVVRDTVVLKDTSEFIKVKVYRDILKNEDVELYSYHLIDGNLLDSQLSYKLNVPREITITNTLEYPKTYRSGMYFFSEIGGSIQQFNNLSFGLQYNRKGNWFVSYRLNINELTPISHNIGVGFRIFK